MSVICETELWIFFRNNIRRVMPWVFYQADWFLCSLWCPLLLSYQISFFNMWTGNSTSLNSKGLQKLRFSKIKLTFIGPSCSNQIFIVCSGSNRSVFYLYGATSVGLMLHPSLVRMHTYQGAQLLYGNVHTLQASRCLHRQ